MKLWFVESRPLCPKALTLLQPQFEFVECRPAEVVWTRLTPVRPSDGCKVIVTPCTGIDHIDLAECNRRGVEVLSLKGETEFLETVHATAEHTIALILASLRRLPMYLKSDWLPVYLHSDCRSQLGTELHDKTVLIVGRGRVGKQVGEILTAFGCIVIYVDRDGDLMESLPLADIVSVHVDLNDTTEGMFTMWQFLRMKPACLFVNTSRPQVVNSDHLDAALKLGVIGGAAIDFAGPCTHGMIRTPHIGGWTVESVEKTEVFMAHKLIAWKKALLCAKVDHDAKNAPSQTAKEKETERAAVV